MKLMIEIDDELYEIIKNPKKLESMYHAGKICEAVRKGMPLPINTITIPKGATNGEVIETVTGEEFSRGASVYNHDLMIGEGEAYMAFNVDWWNSKFKTESNESEEQCIADDCTYSETGCGSCKRQLDCPVKSR